MLIGVLVGAGDQWSLVLFIIHSITFSHRLRIPAAIVVPTLSNENWEKRTPKVSAAQGKDRAALRWIPPQDVGQCVSGPDEHKLCGGWYKGWKPFLSLVLKWTFNTTLLLSKTECLLCLTFWETKENIVTNHPGSFLTPIITAAYTLYWYPCDSFSLGKE